MNRLVIDNMHLVPKVIFKTFPYIRRHEFDDVEGDGNLGLVKAAVTFNDNVPFEAHAWLRIRAEIIDGVRSRNHSRNRRQIKFVPLDDNRIVGCDDDRLDLPIADARELQRRMVRTLDWQQRFVVGMRYWGRLNNEEIGAILGVSRSRVSQIGTQALVLLRESFGRS